MTIEVKQLKIAILSVLWLLVLLILALFSVDFAAGFIVAAPLYMFVLAEYAVSEDRKENN